MSEVLSPTSVATRTASWRASAACQGVKPDLFFPVGSGEAALRQVADAKMVCQSCPVRQPCLQFAIAAAIPCGIFGGLTEEERRALRRRLAPAGRRVPGPGELPTFRP